MPGADLFFIIILVTVLVVRISVLLVPNKDLKLFGVIIHHFWIGVVLVLVGWFIQIDNIHISSLVLGIGLGLIADHFVYMIFGAGGDKEYWSKISLGGAVTMLIILFLFRTELYSLFLGI